MGQISRKFEGTFACHSMQKRYAIRKNQPKPVGPYKLAKALRLCLTRAEEANKAPEDQSSPVTTFKGNTSDSTSDAVPNNLDATIDQEKNEMTPMTIRDKGVDTPMAVDKVSAGKGDPSETDQSDFPFPVTGLGAIHSVDDSSNRKTLASKDQALPTSTAPLSALSQTGESAVSAKPPSPSNNKQSSRKRRPRILLVDDNSINLRLLETFMKKRKYKLVDSADNGLLAVQAVEHSEPYDVIFMGNVGRTRPLDIRKY